MLWLGLLGVALALGGCGSGAPSESATGTGSGSEDLTVSAAASLTEPLTVYGESFDGPTVRLSFGASDELAAQIRQGATPDVYAAANTTLPDDLQDEGLVGKPTVFATNELVIAVPDGSEVGSIEDLAEPGLDLVIGSATVPVGAYTRTVLERLADRGEAILANVRSEEPDVKSIVGKLTQGAADAGFVYVSDVVATGGALRAVELPARLAPEVAYAAAVVEGSDQPGEAQRFIDGLLSGKGAEQLAGAGFGPSPGK